MGYTKAMELWTNLVSNVVLGGVPAPHLNRNFNSSSEWTRFPLFWMIGNTWNTWTHKTWISLSWLNYSTNSKEDTERKITTMYSPEQKGTFLISVWFHITSVCPKPRTIPMTVINKTMNTRLQTIERRVSASIL